MRFYYQFSFVSGSQIHQNRVLEASREVLKVCWGCLGTSWERLGTSRNVLERLGAVLERLGTSWSRLRSVLDASWGCLRRSEPFRPANNAPSRAGREGGRGRVNPTHGFEDWRIGEEDWRNGAKEQTSTRPEARGLGGFYATKWLRTKVATSRACE